MQIMVSIGAVWVSPQIGEMLPPYDFFDCPVLSLPFLSILRQGRTAGPIFTPYWLKGRVFTQEWSFWG